MYRHFCLTVVFFLCSAVIATGETITLTDLNSVAHFDLGTGGLGMDSWSVSGVNQLKEQSFWYRVGNTEAPQRINSLTPTAAELDGLNHFSVTYSDPGQRFQIDLEYTLTGGSGADSPADLYEGIRIRNTSGAALDFHFYQYVDLDLGGTAHDTMVTMTGGILGVNTADQWDGTNSVSETVLAPRPSRYQAGYYPNLLTSLAAGTVGFNLDNTVSASDGDLAWAFQWDKVITKGGSYTISKDKILTLTVPEPGTLALLAAGGLCLLACAWRRKSR
jgi:hypothetical protein